MAWGRPVGISNSAEWVARSSQHFLWSGNILHCLCSGRIIFVAYIILRWFFYHLKTARSLLAFHRITVPLLWGARFLLTSPRFSLSCGFSLSWISGGKGFLRPFPVECPTFVNVHLLSDLASSSPWPHHFCFMSCSLSFLSFWDISNTAVRLLSCLACTETIHFLSIFIVDHFN